MIEAVFIGVIAALIVAIGFIWWIINLPDAISRYCDYCSRKTYLGTFKEPPENQHWRTFTCRHCGAELVHK
jgi:prepilin signal peptidase PulO-like enzyme (type II secretory pathway)